MFYYRAQTIKKNGSSYSGDILWNSLPCDVRQAPGAESLGQFKRVLKQVL